METNQIELGKLSKQKLIEIIGGYEERLTNMEDCESVLRVAQKEF